MADISAYADLRVKHFQDNIESKLKSLNLEPSSCEEILGDIFGVTHSEQTQLGLIDAVDALDFASKLDALEEHWNHFEMSEKRMVASEANSAETESQLVC